MRKREKKRAAEKGSEARGRADVNFFRFLNYCDCGGSGEKLQCISLWSTL